MKKESSVAAVVVICAMDGRHDHFWGYFFCGYDRMLGSNLACTGSPEAVFMGPFDNIT